MKAFCSSCDKVTEHAIGLTVVKHCKRCRMWNGTAHGNQLAGQVAAYREHQAAARRLSGRTLTGRNQAARDRAYISHLDETGRIVTALMVAGHKALVGHLTEEARLVTRLQAARKTGHDRPELKHRLTLTRRAIDDLLETS